MCAVYPREREKTIARNRNERICMREVCVKYAWTCDVQNLNCIMVETQSKPTSIHSIIIKHTSIMHKNIVRMQWECYAWAYSNNFTKANPKISRKTQKPQKFWKTLKPRSKMHEWMKKEKIRTLTKCLKLDLGGRTHG